MKKTLGILGSIALGLYAFLTVIDKSDYKLEKRLWHLQKEFESLAADPGRAPDQRFEDVAGKYEALRKQYPSKLSSQIPLQVGQIYLLKKDYKKARNIFLKIVEENPHNPNLSAAALFQVGQSFELGKDWSEALKVYESITEKFPLTPLGLNAPLYIVQHYFNNNALSMATQAFNKAVAFYTSISQEHPRSMIEFNALQLLSSGHLMFKNWREAVDVLEKLLMNYSSAEFFNPQRIEVLIKTINTVSITRMKDYEKPVKIYTKFIEKNPQHSLNPFLTEMVLGLKDLKDKASKMEINK